MARYAWVILPRESTGWVRLPTVAAYESFAGYCEQLHAAGAQILSGGEQTRDGDLEQGFYCQPTLAELALDHACGKRKCSCRS